MAGPRIGLARLECAAEASKDGSRGNWEMEVGVFACRPLCHWLERMGAWTGIFKVQCSCSMVRADERALA